MPFSEEDRVEWRTSKNRRNPSLKNRSAYGSILLTPEQTQELYLFLEQHQSVIREFADARTMEVGKVLGQIYNIILGWRSKKGNNRQDNSMDTDMIGLVQSLFCCNNDIATRECRA